MEQWNFELEDAFIVVMLKTTEIMDHSIVLGWYAIITFIECTVVDCKWFTLIEVINRVVFLATIEV